MRTFEDPAPTHRVAVPSGEHADQPRRPPGTAPSFFQHSVSLWAWPSRGGLIVLERATTLDFSFLGLSAVTPSLRRDADQAAEDEFCKHPLALGARWFDSYERYGFIANVADDHDPSILALEAGEAQKPTRMERLWVSVAYPNGREGGLWVAEFDTVMYVVEEKGNLLPSDTGKVLVARTMDEECEILKGMGAKYYANLGKYDGAACLKVWELKTSGELGELVQTQYFER